MRDKVAIGRLVVGLLALQAFTLFTGALRSLVDAAERSAAFRVEAVTAHRFAVAALGVVLSGLLVLGAWALLRNRRWAVALVWLLQVPIIWVSVAHLWLAVPVLLLLSCSLVVVLSLVMVGR